MMTTLTVKLTFYMPGAASLKDKRRVCRSLVDKTRARFNVSVAEVDTQDVHRTLTLGAAVVSGDAGHARRSLDEVIRYMEEHADAELIKMDEGGAVLKKKNGAFPRPFRLRWAGKAMKKAGDRRNGAAILRRLA